MAKSIGLKQLAQKVYTIVKGLNPAVVASLGEIEDAFDMIIYGPSGSGKSNFTAIVLIELLNALKCRCEYVAYEEGHAKTVQDTMIHRHKMLDFLGNCMTITDHYTFDELRAKMAKKQSAKIWVIDSIQASRLTDVQCDILKREFVLSRKKKIIIYISWSEGQLPKGAAGKSVEYYANIKVRVEGKVAFFKSRYGGNNPFVIWEKAAKEYWEKKYKSKTKGSIPYKTTISNENLSDTTSDDTSSIPALAVSE